MKHIFFGAILLLSLAACNDAKKDEPKIADAIEPTAASSSPKPVEFADAKYMDMANKNIAALVNKDVDGYMAAFADNAIYQLNTGDSIVGKEAISGMWKQSYDKWIDTMSLTNPIYLPVIVNEPQGGIAKGTYLLSWHRMSVKFKSGATSNQSIHVVAHFDANDKIDRLTEFVDRNGFPKRGK